MAHFAHINPDNIVDNVIVAEQDFIDSGVVGDPAEWVQTSYNTHGGIHTDPKTKVKTKEKALRKNYAGPGDTYNKELDAFIPPMPHSGWQLNTDTCQWIPPTPCPAFKSPYYWNDAQKAWVSKEEKEEGKEV